MQPPIDNHQATSCSFLLLVFFFSFVAGLAGGLPRLGLRAEDPSAEGHLPIRQLGKHLHLQTVRVRWLVPQNRTSVLRKPTALRKIMTVLAQVVRPLMLWPVMTMWVPTSTISLKEQGPIYHVAVKAQK